MTRTDDGHPALALALETLLRDLGHEATCRACGGLIYVSWPDGSHGSFFPADVWAFVRMADPNSYRLAA